MKTPLYGDVDDEVFRQQENELARLCPITTDYGELINGKGFTHSDKFLVSGDPEQLSPIKPNGRTNITERHKQTQGYKIHISAHPSKAVEVAQVVLPLLQQTPGGDNPLGGVNYKVAKLKEYALDDKPEAQGKFITIYAKDEEQLKLIAKTVQNELLLTGITSETHGGGLSTGDSRLGTTDMMSMRFGQFSGNQHDEVYLNDTWMKDDRKVPCPEVMQQEFERVLSETNQHMEENRLELLVEQEGPSVQEGTSQPNPNVNSTTPSTRETYKGILSSHRRKQQEEPDLEITNSNSGPNLSTSSTEKVESKEEKKTVGESFRKQAPKHTGGYFDSKSLEEALKGRFPDDDKGGPGVGGGGTRRGKGMV
jgi:hypothetical protein